MTMSPTSEIIKKNTIKNIVAFCILMQNNNGIIGKSPDYIMEKYMRYAANISGVDKTEWGLDASNKALLEIWIYKWVPDELKKVNED